MSDETTLLPCPFCGGANLEITCNDSFNNDFRKGIYCCDCGCGVYPYKNTKSEAIAAWNTRTHGTLTAEQVREAIKQHSFGIQPELGYGEFGRCFHDKSWQAIADELNAELGSGTCEFVVKDNMSESEGMGDVWIECSACHCQFDYYADDWLMKMSYCPNCSARNRKAVGR